MGSRWDVFGHLRLLMTVRFISLLLFHFCAICEYSHLAAVHLHNMRLRLEHQLKTLSRTTVSSRCSQSILPLLAGRQYLQIQSRNPGPSLKRAFTSAKPTQAQNLLPRDFNAVDYGALQPSTRSS
jgi:hypothetical protein